jgi:hypothetical protein
MHPQYHFIVYLSKVFEYYQYQTAVEKYSRIYRPIHLFIFIFEFNP